MCRSEWHTPQRSMRTSTSLPRGSGNRRRSRTGARHRRRATGGDLGHEAFLRRHPARLGRVERAGQCDKSLDRNLLGARGGVDARGGEQRRRIGAERSQALAQHLAALAEGRRGDALERDAVARQRRGARDSRTTDDVTFGGGTKADGATSNRMLRLRAPAGEHAEPAVSLRRPAWRRCARRPRAGTSAPAGRTRAARLGRRASRRAAPSRCCRAGSRRCGRAAVETAAAGRRSSASAATILSRPG